MARLPRYVLPGHPQHIIQRGNNRGAIFINEHDFEFYRECLICACMDHNVQVHAYVFMTNHVHLLMTPNSGNGLSKVMQSVGRRYVQYFNYTYPADRYSLGGSLQSDTDRHGALFADLLSLY